MSSYCFTDLTLEEQDLFIGEVIQAILKARDALEKPIEERNYEDIKRIDNLCSLVHGFNAFPKTVRRALAAHAVLIVIEEEGKELIVHNEELDSFCVLIFGECEQLNVAKTYTTRYYYVGDSFGVCEPTTETIRFVGHMITKHGNCAFLCVKRDDFYTILTDPANYPNREIIRHRDQHGSIVCVSQFHIDKKSTGPLWSYHKHINNSFKIILPDGHIITKATEACLLLALVDGYDKIDPVFIDDFLLLFRVFMTQDFRDKEKKLPPGMINLCLNLAQWLDNVEYRDKVVKIVLIWLSSYYHDFELNSDFSYLFFRLLESKLMNLTMNNQLHLLHVTLSTKSKIRHVTISRSSREQHLGFAISGGYEKNCGIFVTQVLGINSGDCPYDSLKNYLKYPTAMTNSSTVHPHTRTHSDSRPPAIPPRRRTNQNVFYNQEIRTALPLRPGDQLLEVNGTNFAAIKLCEAQKKLDMSTHLSLTVKYNPSAFHEMRALPEGRRKSSLSSMSAVSPYQPANTQNRFTFPGQEPHNSLKAAPSNEQVHPPASPLFSTNVNFGFRSMIRTAPKNAIRLDDLNPTSITDNPSTNGYTNQALVNVLRVFNAANNEFRYLLVHEETTAREVVMVAVKEFNLTGSHSSPIDKSVSSLDWHLYEVSVVPQSKTIKQKCLSEQTSKLAERASLCSRFYIKNSSQSSFGPTRLDMGDDALVSEILKESPANVTLTSLNATLLAVELTLADFDKFKSIEPQQFVYDTFFDYSEKENQSQNNAMISSTDSASLQSSSSDGQEPDLLHTLNKTRSIPKSWMQEYQEFADISNREMFWVVCEILNERNLGRRVKIVKQFVRVADVCYQLRNYNSMFAIISGLGHSCVSRLRRTFEKLKPKYKSQLEKMRSLFDPSKNMSNYRLCLAQTPPPAIPLFPQIKKDLTFTKEGRSIFVRESNDLSDEEDFADTYPQDTIKRRSRNDMLSIKSSNLDQAINLPSSQARSISYTAFNNRITSESESILVNLAEIRQFTERVRNVIHFSSLPYSNDLLTNTKDIQRNQAQIKKMHEEWQMRKRIRHYISQTLISAIDDSQVNKDNFDQTDSASSKNSGKLTINYDERTLYQKSLEVESEVNIKPTVPNPERHTQTSTMTTTSSSASTQSLLHPSNQPQIPPAVLTMHPPSASNSSPTLSKSSSLSSCSSFSHHLPNYPLPPRSNNLMNSVGKFGTESTESLRKLQALSENVNDWKPYNNGSNNGSINSRTSGTDRSKSLVSSRIFPPKNR